MIRLVLLTLLGGALALFNDPRFHSADLSNPEIWKSLKGPISQYRWATFFESQPEELKAMHILENQISKQLKKSEKILDDEVERESLGTQNFCKLYQKFLMNIYSALEDVRQMAEERKVACIGNRQELKDLYDLLSKCAKTRVKLQKELAVYSEAINRALSMAKKTNRGKTTLPEPTLKISLNQTTPTVKEATHNASKSQDVPTKGEVKPENKKVPSDITRKEVKVNAESDSTKLKGAEAAHTPVNGTIAETKPTKQFSLFQVSKNPPTHPSKK